MIKCSQLFSRGPWIVLLVAALSLAGCTATYQAALDRPTARGDTLSLTRLNSRLAERHVVLRRVNGEETQGTYLRSSQDSCYLLTNDSSTVSTVVILTSNIRSVEYKDHWSGFVGGLIGGFVVGVLLGAATVAYAWSGGTPVIGFALLAACIFSFIGLPILGAVDGVHSTVLFPADSTKETVLQQVAPDPSADANN